MDRQIVYPAQVPLDSDLLNAQRNAHVGLGQLAGMAYGADTVAAGGFACTPGGGMAVSIAPGSLLAAGVVDVSAYGTLAASASPLVRQYASRDPVTLDVPGAGAGYVVYVTPATVDAGDTVLPFYNAADPSVTYAGAGNGGQAAPTVRRDVAQPGIGTGVPAGAYALWSVNVPAGATAITADMIARAPGAPFYDTIPQLQAAKQDALGFTPTQQGGGVDQVAGKVFLGRDTTYPGLRYSYVNGGGNTITGGYLLSTYGTELNAAYGQLGDLSQDSGDRLVYQSYAMNGTYYTAALLSDITAEAAARAAADASLMAGFAGGLSANNDRRLYGGHLNGATGRVAISWDGGEADMAFATDVTNEATARAAADAQLVNGVLAMGATDYQCLGIHFDGVGRMMGVYDNGAGGVYPTIALYTDVTNEAAARAAADANLMAGFVGGISASGDRRLYGGHLDGGSGRVAMSWDGGQADLAFASDVTGEAASRAAADAQLVSGTYGMGPGDAQILGIHTDNQGYVHVWDSTGDKGMLEWHSSSDPSLKANMTPVMPDVLADLDKIRMYSFDWKDGYVRKGHVPVGFSSKNLLDVWPDTVRTSEKNPDSIDLLNLIARQMAAIRQLKDIVAELRSDVAALKAGAAARS